MPDDIRTLTVRFTYRLRFTRGVFQPANGLLRTLLEAPSGVQPKALVVIDRSVVERHPGLLAELAAWAAAWGMDLLADPVVLAGGEAAKDGWPVVERLGALAQRVGLDRHSYLVAIGGGAVLDAAGFAAALIHRGVRLVRLPTTTLAQADAGLGVKNAVNAFGGKNFLGTFQPPWAVVNDLALLDSLDQRGWRDGLAEAVKVAVIKDVTFLAELDASADRLTARDPQAMETAIRRCADLHLDHIFSGGDPFELGSSRPLDFGHWSAHALELLSRHRLSHGEAVAIGLALDLCYAENAGWLADGDARRVVHLLRRLGFPCWDDLLDQRGADGQRMVLGGLAAFREHLGGSLTLAMPDGLGRRQDIHELDLPRFDRAVERVRLLASEPLGQIPR